VNNGTFVLRILILIGLTYTLTACRDNGTPPQLAAYDYASATLYCEGSGGHRDWPNFNRVMIEFFSHPEKFL